MPNKDENLDPPTQTKWIEFEQRFTNDDNDDEIYMCDVCGQKSVYEFHTGQKHGRHTIYGVRFMCEGCGFKFKMSGGAVV